jgi:hypothetical protein
MQRWSKAFPAGICISALAALATPLASASLARVEAAATAAPTQLQIAGASSLKARLTAGNPALGKFDGSFLRIKAAYDAASTGGTRGSVDLAAANPKAHLRYESPLAAPSVLIDAIVSGDPQVAKAQLENLGFKTSAVFRNDIGGWLPVDRAADAAALSSLRFAKTAMMHTRSRANAAPADPVAYEGDFVQGSLALKQATGLNGSGITVGVISDSFNCNGQYDAANPGGTHLGDYADDVALGALPAGVNIIKDDPNLNSTGAYCTGTDEGRALAQIVYAVAPGAKLAFYTADGSEADFAQGIITLAMPTSQTNPVNNLKGGGAQIVDDDVGYFDEPVYQEGEVGIAVDTVVAQGALYFSSAANEGVNSYETASASFTGTAATGAPNAGEQTLLIGTDASGNKYYYLPITIPRLPPGGEIPISLFWDQPYQSGYPNDPGDVLGAPGVANGPGAASVMDICVGDASGNVPTTGSLTNGTDTVGVGNNPDPANDNCSGPSGVAPNIVNGTELNPIPGEADPYNLVVVFNPSSNATSAPIQASLIIGLVSGPAPDRVKVIIQDDGLGTQITRFATNSSTMQGHPLSPNAMAVAAMFYGNSIACGQTANTVEPYSSNGGSEMLFGPNGVALPSPYVPNKPDITAPDGITTSFFGYAPFYTLAANAPAQCQPGAYVDDSFFGTSAAAPHAAGLAALLMQADPSASNGEIYNTMRLTATPMGSSTGYNYASGNGLVQAQAAKTLLDSLVAPPQSSGGGGGGAFAPLLLLPGLLLAGLRRRKRR